MAARLRNADAPCDADVDIDGLHAVFEDAFGRIFRGEVENDDYNRLVVAARIPAAEIVVLRGYAKYLRQIGFPLSETFIESTLAANASIARNLLALWKARFDPDLATGADAAVAARLADVEAALEAVDNLSEDRVLRQLLALIMATTRTNFWRRDTQGRPRTFLSFKFDPSRCRDCRSRGRCSRSSSIRRGSRVST
jgi:glutamate dehydrogenase